MIDIDSIKHYLLDLQERICSEFISIDSNLVLKEDEWQRETGGGGRTRVLRKGKIFEQGGINFSHVHGDNLPPSATAQRPELAGRSFQALGNSLVIHPLNPYIPTTHMNIRFFSADKENEESIWWFGGGFDLTPYYGFTEDAKHWHEMGPDDTVSWLLRLISDLVKLKLSSKKANITNLDLREDLQGLSNRLDLLKLIRGYEFISLKYKELGGPMNYSPQSILEEIALFWKNCNESKIN